MGEWSRVPCETVSCVNQRETFTQYWASLSEEEKHLARFASWYVCDAFLHHRVLLFMKTPENVAIKVYKLTFLEILVLSYCHVHTIPTYRVYWLYTLYLAETKYLCFKLKTLKHCNVYSTTPTFCDHVTIGVNRPALGGTLPNLTAMSRCPALLTFYPAFWVPL